MNKITALSWLAKEYTDGLFACNTFDELKIFLEDFKSVASDAFESMPTTTEEFWEFKTGLMLERNGEHAGEIFSLRYGNVLMPNLLVRVALTAQALGVPDGLMFLRMVEQEAIVKSKDGTYALAFAIPKMTGEKSCSNT